MNYLEKLKSHNIKDLSKLQKITQDEAFKNLCYFTNLIEDLEYFIFFGTLLGLTREKNIIEGDDDIDFYVNIKHRKDLINILRANSSNVDENLHVNRDQSFLQTIRAYQNKVYLVDFYFYDADTDENFIIEKWNYQGMPHIPLKHLRTPKIFIFPIKKKLFRNIKINFPSQPTYLCDFLYGPEWKKKLKKDSEYTVKVINNKPVFFKIKKNFFGKNKIIELDDL